ncbi:hypothetical protein Scep_028309 [Stephania cephalantha]|uniref:V-type proton ATPase subunit G n=1 Tax=Stephania cephalantha TaxID=152367 RepID=A0AAP0ECY4_9MAGN
MMKGQGGVQMLLTAEQEAQQIVADARNLKVERLKQARNEANTDIGVIRSNLEAEYQKKLSETSGYSGMNVKLLGQETEMKIQKLKAATSQISQDVVQMLINHVTTVRN